MKQEPRQRRREMKKGGRQLLCLILCGLAAAALYFTDTYITIAGFGVSASLPFLLIMILIGFLDFLITPRLARLILTGKQLMTLQIPVLFPFLWSLLVWILTSAGMSEIRRGLVSVMYLFFGICAMAAFVYVAGEDAIWWFLLSLIASNLVVMIPVIASNGIMEFLNELWRLIITFAGETGPVMQQLEVHGVTYALGIYLTFFLVWHWDLRKKALPAAAAVLCFLTGMKRIGVAAVLAAGLFGMVLMMFRRFREIERFVIRVAGVVLLVAALAYVGAIFYGLFDYMEQIGIDTNMRSHIYSIYRPYYTFSPAFTGNGTGWVDDMFQTWQAAADELTIYEVYHTHNDYLREYIELGMAGFLCWCLLRFHYQVSRAFRLLGDEAGILCLALVLYMGITYMTDSTATQLPVNNAFAVFMLAFQLTGREEKQDQLLELENRRISDPAEIEI